MESGDGFANSTYIYIYIYTFTLKVKWPMLLTAAVIIHTSPRAKISGFFGACTC